MDVKIEEAYWCKLVYLYLGCVGVTGGWTQLISSRSCSLQTRVQDRLQRAPAWPSHQRPHTDRGHSPGYVAESFSSKLCFYEPLQIGECMDNKRDVKFTVILYKCRYWKYLNKDISRFIYCDIIFNLMDPRQRAFITFSLVLINQLVAMVVLAASYGCKTSSLLNGDGC